MIPRNLDVLKWVGASAMLVDHVWLYVFGATYWSEAAGSLAFPLFALALAEGVRNQNDASRNRTMVRLLVGALVAQLALELVRHGLPLNVIFTLAAGVALDSAARVRTRSCAAVAIAALVVVGALCEYAYPGVLFVFAVARWSATRREVWLAAALPLLALCGLANGNQWALVAPLVVVAVSLLPRDAPRARNAFYWVYTLQWPAIAALGVFLKTA